ncbi:MAG: hypothetical protein NT069_11635 [Planctomycetota bacterium]|nr:hypothetical protein [Planctomycetota bacterium]
MAATLVPPSFLFRFSLPVRHAPRIPGTDDKLLNLSEAHRLPDLGPIEGRTGFADVRLGWNERGLGISVEVRGKKKGVIGRQPIPSSADRLRLWIDTRNTQNIHRAGKFCHEFHLYPAAGPGPKGDPVAELRTIDRARESPSTANLSLVRTRMETLSGGYRLEAWFPVEVLTGYSPGEQAKLGFYYHFRDTELGDQFLSMGREFPFDYDPSLWQTLELVGA